jgi:hypothetical protein
VVTIDNDVYGPMTWKRVAWRASPTNRDPQRIIATWASHCYFCGTSILARAAAANLNRKYDRLVCPHHRPSRLELYTCLRRNTRPLCVAGRGTAAAAAGSSMTRSRPPAERRRRQRAAVHGEDLWAGLAALYGRNESEPAAVPLDAERQRDEGVRQARIRNAGAA